MAIWLLFQTTYSRNFAFDPNHFLLYMVFTLLYPLILALYVWHVWCVHTGVQAPPPCRLFATCFSTPHWRLNLDLLLCIRLYLSFHLDRINSTQHPPACRQFCIYLHLFLNVVRMHPSHLYHTKLCCYTYLCIYHYTCIWYGISALHPVLSA